MRRALLIAFVLCAVIISKGQVHFEKTLSINFPNGVSNQCAYIQFPSVPLWGYIEVTITSGYSHQRATGKITKRYEIGHNPGGYFYQNTEVPVVFGDIASQWFIGDFDNINNRIPIHHLVSTGNLINIYIESLLYSVSGIDNLTNNTLITGPETVLSSNTRHYPSIIQERLGIGTKSPLFSAHLSDLSLDNSAFNTQLAIDGNTNLESSNNNFDVNKPSIGLIFRRDWDSMGTPKALAGIYAWGAYNWAGGLAFTTTPAYNNGVQITRMIITDIGNVGIGTTNPQSKLAVNGDIKAKEVNVTLEGWPDFVFKPNYRLRPISEVEQFIKTNSHLPEIPSEAEVKENGIGLGEMNAKLLQKIEEMTLYLIDASKSIEQLNDKVNKQQELIDTIIKENKKLKKSIKK